MSASKTAASAGQGVTDSPGSAQTVGHRPIPVAEGNGTHPGSDLTGLDDLIHEFEERIARLGDLDASRVRLVFQDGLLVLTGTVNSKDERRRVGACAVSVAEDVPVSNRVRIIPSP